MRFVLRFTAAAQAIAFHGHRQDNRRLALGLHRIGVSRIDFIRVVTTAIQVHDVVVGQVFDQLQQFRVFAEEVLASVGATIGLVVLQFAIDHFIHPATQQTGVVLLQQLVPQTAPDDFHDVPTRTAEHAFQLLNDLAVTANRTIQTLQVAVDDKAEVIELLATCQRDGAERFRLIALAVTHEAPDLAVAVLNQSAALLVFHDMSLINGLNRTQSHADGRELPVVGHQPGVGIRRQAVAIHFAAEAVQLIFTETPFQI